MQEPHPGVFLAARRGMKKLLIASLLFPLSALAQPISSDPYQPLVRQVQERLNQLGFDAGPVDGEFNEKTQAALAQFQLSLVIPAGGQLDPLTLNELGVSAESASAGGSATPETEQ